MSVGYYTTVMRETGGGRKVGYLFGPFDDEPTARGYVEKARYLAEQHDPFTAFDLFGTASITSDGPLPRGTFNHALGELLT